MLTPVGLGICGWVARILSCLSSTGRIKSDQFNGPINSTVPGNLMKNDSGAFQTIVRVVIHGDTDKNISIFEYSVEICIVIGMLIWRGDDGHFFIFFLFF